MTETRLAEKVIVVTGASGIAAAGANLFAEQGATVFVVSRTSESARSLAEAILDAGGQADWAAADLTDEQQTVDAFQSCIGAHGRIDGLFGVAGGSGRRFGDGPIHDVPLEGWDETIRTNGRPAFLAAREAVRAMMTRDGGGSIVLISSVLAWSPVPGMFATHAYAAVKGAEIALVTSMAAQYASTGIRVNVIAPGLVDTPMARRALNDPEILAFAVQKQPLTCGPLEARDVAEAGLFLLSHESRAITGQSIAVDGGWSVTAVAP